MTKNILIRWVLPTTRQLGGPLPIEDIRDSDIELSADAGLTYVPIGTFLNTVLEVPVADLPFSDQYIARGRSTDITNQPGNWFEVPFTLSDDSPPGDLVVSIVIQ